jgi:hypothetical protein
MSNNFIALKSRALCSQDLTTVPGKPILLGHIYYSTAIEFGLWSYIQLSNLGCVVLMFVLGVEEFFIFHKVLISTSYCRLYA